MMVGVFKSRVNKDSGCGNRELVARRKTRRGLRAGSIIASPEARVEGISESIVRTHKDPLLQVR